MTLSPGTRLGAYEIVSLVGSGGMGEVYRANDTRLDRTVAIKVVAGRVPINPEFRQRFEREARHIAALNHPRICTLFDVGHQDEINFLVMEYLEGETLSRRLRRGAVPLEQALKIAIEICDALASAHRHGIVHRDLKPANVMLTKSGAKLLDFGLALSMAPMMTASIDTTVATQDHRLMPEESLVGTLPYMAPEQISSGRIDDRTDIFAFGSLLYEMTTGQERSRVTDRGDLIVKILDRNPPPLGERVASCRRRSIAWSGNAWRRIPTSVGNRRTSARRAEMDRRHASVGGLRAVHTKTPCTPVRPRCRRSGHNRRPRSRRWVLRLGRRSSRRLSSWRSCRPMERGSGTMRCRRMEPEWSSPPRATARPNCGHGPSTPRPRSRSRGQQTRTIPSGRRTGSRSLFSPTES